MICNKRINYIFGVYTLMSRDNISKYGCLVATL